MKRVDKMLTVGHENSPAHPSQEETEFWSASSSNKGDKQIEYIESSVDDEDGDGDGDDGTERDSSATNSTSSIPQNRTRMPPLRWSLAAGRHRDDDMETDSATDSAFETSATPDEPEDEDDGDTTVVLAKPPPPRRTFSLLRNSIVRSSEVVPPPISYTMHPPPSQVLPSVPSAVTPRSGTPPARRPPTTSLGLPTEKPELAFPFEITPVVEEHIVRNIEFYAFLLLLISFMTRRRCGGQLVICWCPTMGMTLALAKARVLLGLRKQCIGSYLKSRS